MNLTQTAVINGHEIKNMLLGAYAAFAAGYRQIDELNAFPVLRFSNIDLRSSSVFTILKYEYRTGTVLF